MTCVGVSSPSSISLADIVYTKIHNCLDEYLANGTLIKSAFEGSRYSSIYQAMLDLIEDVKNDPYHGNKWQENRKHWARKGW